MNPSPARPVSAPRALLGMVWIVGCTGTPAPAVETRPDAPQPEVVAAAPQPVAPAEAPPAEAPPTTPPATPPEVKTIGPADEPAPQPVPVTASGPVAVTPIAAAELPRFPLPPPVDPSALPSIVPGWQVVQEFDREVHLEPLDGGVVCRLGGVPHELGPDGALVEKPMIDFPLNPMFSSDEALLGVWPGDAWRVRERPQDREGSLLSFMRWRGGNRWVAQNTTEYDINDLAGYRWSPRSGILLTEAFHEGAASFVRLAGKHPPPPEMPLLERDRVVDFYESAGGTLFVFVDPQRDEPGETLEILRSCEDATPGCERTSGVTLYSPEKHNFRTGAMAARQRRSISAAIFAEGYQVLDRSYLVHYETGGWKLESVPGDAKVTQLLPAPDGGLWIAAHGGKTQLWHRSEAGKWAAVTMPERWTGGVELARRDDQSVWLAVNAGEHHAIYAAAAVQQAAAAATAASGQG